MRLLIIFLCVFLAGCETMYKPTENRQKVELTIIIDDDLSWLKLGKNVKGYHRCSGNKCIIWIPSGINDCSMEVLAHEMMHVKYGNYHDQNHRLRNC